MSKCIENFINKDENIIACKKRAKQISKENQQLSLSHCKDLAAIELGFKNWFDLHNKVKIKYNSLPVKQISTTLFDSLLNEALHNEASDIHISYRDNQAKIDIKLRIHNEFKDYEHNINYANLLDIFSYIYNNQLDNLINDNPFASIIHNINGRQLRITSQAVLSYPSGFDIIIQIVFINNNDHSMKSLEQLGYEKGQARELMESLSNPQGALFIAGNTGSGRTTTLKCLLSKYQKTYPAKKIDIIDYPINTYLDIIKKTEEKISDLRLITNCMDQLSAKTIYNNSHNCFMVSGIPANSPFLIFERLKDFNLSNKQLANPGFLKTLAYQKLLPIVCPHCSEDATLFLNTVNEKYSQATVRYIDFFTSFKVMFPHIDISKVKLRSNNGCQFCHYTGIIGRTVCAQVVVLDKNMYQLIEEDKISELKKYWKTLSDNDLSSHNMLGKIPMEHALYKMLQGLIDPLDIENAFLPINDLK